MIIKSVDAEALYPLDLLLLDDLSEQSIYASLDKEDCYVHLLI